MTEPQLTDDPGDCLRFIVQASHDPEECGGKIALVGVSLPAVRAMARGVLDLCAQHEWRATPKWEPGLGHAGRLIWPNGVEALCFTASVPHRVRGHEFGLVWCDGIASDHEIVWLLRPAVRAGTKPALMLS